jgi:hypothetical protein
MYAEETVLYCKTSQKSRHTTSSISLDCTDASQTGKAIKYYEQVMPSL